MSDNIQVECPECGCRFDEEDVEFLDIEEDFVGRDVESFRCPECGKEVKSFRYG